MKIKYLSPILPILFVLLMSTFSHAYTECKKELVLENAKTAKKNLSSSILRIKDILAGSNTGGFSAQEFFGHDFKVELTPQKISELRTLLSESDGVSVENAGLLNCLSKLKQVALKEQLISASKEYINLRIELLEKNKNLSDSIRVQGLTENELPSIKEKIDKDSKELISAKTNLENKLIKKISETTKEKSNKRREVLEYENNLTKIKIELLDLKLNSNRKLEEKIKYFEEINTKLKIYGGKLKTLGDDELRITFKDVEQTWLAISRENYYDLFNISSSINLPTLPSPLKQEDYDIDIGHIKKMRDEIVGLKKDIVRNYTEKKREELKLLNNLVASVNSIRESFFKKLGSDFFFSEIFSSGSYKLLKNEIVSSPYRVLSYFYSKFLYVSESISLGKQGYARLFSDVFVIVLIIITVFILRLLFSKVIGLVDNSLNFLVRRGSGVSLYKKIISLWNKLKDIAIPSLWLITLLLVHDMSILHEYKIILKFIEVLLAARILKTLVTLFLGNISRLDTGNFLAFMTKAGETSNIFKNIFVFYFSTMIVIELTIGRVYLYTLVNYVVLFYAIYHFLKESSRWEAELRKYAEKMFAGVIVERFFAFIDYTPKVVRSSLLLVFILILMIFDLIAGLTENLEFSKKVQANLFKKQIEKVEAREGADLNIPVDYKDQFSLKSLSGEEEYVENSNNIEERIIQEVMEWSENRLTEHSVVVYGDKGIGKTTLLKRVGSILGENSAFDIIYTKMPSKILTQQDLNNYIHDIFNDNDNNKEQSGDFHIYDYDQALEKSTVVFIDESQNVFLSQTGGFDAYYELVNIMNLNTKNIFWVMSFNKFSWLYLDRAFGRNQFFRNVFELKGWNDIKIKELIMKRHSKTQFRLSFDLLINATKSQDEIDKYSSIESKFFKLLWELSRGNPRAALNLWISALSRRNRNSFNVNIPRESDLEGLESMPDDLLFVISHVIKHENLTSQEIAKTTNLQPGIVRNAIKLGLERKIFYRDERGRYMVDISNQYGLIRFLQVKNFIYGS